MRRSHRLAQIVSLVVAVAIGLALVPGGLLAPTTADAAAPFMQFPWDKSENPWLLTQYPHPATTKSGLDWAKDGTSRKVLAMFAGVVTQASDVPTTCTVNGQTVQTTTRMVRVKASDRSEYEVGYWQFDTLNVTQGQVVNKGQHLGSTGRFGCENETPHLHAELFISGVRASWVGQVIDGWTVPPQTGPASLAQNSSNVRDDLNYRVELTWSGYTGSEDLDAHLYLPPATPAYVSFGKLGSTTAFPWAKLRDDQAGTSGTEIVDISRVLRGTYVYYVHNYLHNFSYHPAGASLKVLVYKGSSLVKTYLLPAGYGKYWDVFRLVDGSLVDVNKVATSSPAPYGSATSATSAASEDDTVEPKPKPKTKPAN